MTANYPEGSTAASTESGVGGSSAGAKEQARQAAGTAADEGRHVAGVAQGEAQRVASEARYQVRGLVGQATSQVEDQSRTQLGRLAELLRSFSEDLERMAGQAEGPASGLAQEVAERARGLSSQLQGREPRELLEEVRGFARRKPGVFLGSALVAGVVAGRLTRGAKDAQSSSGGSYDQTYGYPSSAPLYDSPRAADVTSPGQPLSSGYAAPSSGPVSDPLTQGRGTASGDPLAGVATPETPPVYPGGAEGGRA